jgi:hypothetical protein
MRPKENPYIHADIVAAVANAFPSFGGGKGSEWNPVAAALKNDAPQFAAGVDIGQVVTFIAGLVLDEVERLYPEVRELK